MRQPIWHKGLTDMRILFFQGFVSPEMDCKASDAVGYGITAAEAIIEGLSARDVSVVLTREVEDEALRGRF